MITYNDTKWKTINDRILPLVESQSRLIEDQPFAVVGNSYGIDKLMNLMQDSNYTFDDINDALVETYKFNYKNAMSRMLVNTHAVICSFSNRDNENVSYDSASNYYIIDVPYDQMHFGERDEFIRQRLHDMHVKSTNKWIHIKDLNSIQNSNSQIQCRFTISLYMKDYFTLEQVEEIKNIIPILPHHNDDIIINTNDYPYYSGQSIEIYKWKPNEENTIDFEIQYNQQKDIYNLYVCGEEKLIQVGNLSFKNDYDKEKFLSGYNSNNINIAECFYDKDLDDPFTNKKGGWRFSRYRNDKGKPNFIDI